MKKEDIETKMTLFLRRGKKDGRRFSIVNGGRGHTGNIFKNKQMIIKDKTKRRNYKVRVQAESSPYYRRTFGQRYRVYLK